MITDEELYVLEKGLVKPLEWEEWEDADFGMCTKWRAMAIGGQYELVSFDGEVGFAVNFSWGRPLSFWFIQGEPDEWGPTGPKMFPSLDDAKAAAQTDCERRILSTLTFDPDTIRRLIARLREAEEKLANYERVIAAVIVDAGGRIQISRRTLSAIDGISVRTEFHPESDSYICRVLCSQKRDEAVSKGEAE